MAEIIVVDDNLPTCNALMYVFRALGHQVSCYHSGLELMSDLARRRVSVPSLFIIDGEMPAMSGLDVIRTLKADEACQSVPIVMFTANTDPALRRRALAVGADDFWIKGTTDFDQIESRTGSLLHYHPDMSEVATSTVSRRNFF